MKTKIFLPILALLFCITGKAQENTSNPVIDRLYLNLSSSVMPASKGYSNFDTDFSIGWKFTPSFFAFATVNGGKTLFEKDGVKDHFGHTNLGAGVGYRLFCANKSVDFKAAVSSSIGKCDWKNTAYDVGVYYRLGKSNLAPQIGLGYRFNDSHTVGIKSHGNIYASIGFSF